MVLASRSSRWRRPSMIVSRVGHDAASTGRARAMIARSASENSDAFRSSVSTAKNAFLCGELAAERVRDAHRPLRVGLDQRRTIVGARDDVVDQHAAVDEIDRARPSAVSAPFVERELARIADERRHARAP